MLELATYLCGPFHPGLYSVKLYDRQCFQLCSMCSIVYMYMHMYTHTYLYIVLYMYMRSETVAYMYMYIYIMYTYPQKHVQAN